eukprot:12660225-Alexandrium_andersonii.AAC.1
MSASLVGSEMCIRDRYLAWAAFAGRRLPRFLACLRARLCALPADGSLAPCLLYTSDAADDM